MGECVGVYMCICMFSGVQPFVTPWTLVHQTPLSMEFCRQECWSGLPFSTPRCLPDSEIKSESLVSPALGARFFTTMPPGKPYIYMHKDIMYIEIHT